MSPIKLRRLGLLRPGVLLCVAFCCQSTAAQQTQIPDMPVLSAWTQTVVDRLRTHGEREMLRQFVWPEDQWKRTVHVVDGRTICVIDDHRAYTFVEVLRDTIRGLGSAPVSRVGISRLRLVGGRDGALALFLDSRRPVIKHAYLLRADAAAREVPVSARSRSDELLLVGLGTRRKPGSDAIGCIGPVSVIDARGHIHAQAALPDGWAAVYCLDRTLKAVWSGFLVGVSVFRSSEFPHGLYMTMRWLPPLIFCCLRCRTEIGPSRGSHQ